METRGFGPFSFWPPAKLKRREKMIELHYFHNDTSIFDFKCTLDEFVAENNYDGIEDDIEKIKSARIGDVVIFDHAYTVKRY
tara:strand:+ start:315 stop:560 length:246 start_codon:yes stop_codon:yes gene_type:complete